MPSSMLVHTRISVSAPPASVAAGSSKPSVPRGSRRHAHGLDRLEAGLTMFDSADIYSQGRAEEVLGAAIAGARRY